MQSGSVFLASAANARGGLHRTDRLVDGLWVHKHDNSRRVSGG